MGKTNSAKYTKVIIASLGGSPQPVIMSVSAHNPEKIIFFASHDTVKLSAEVLACLDYSPQVEFEIADDPNLIAAAATTEAIPGGSENAIAIAELQNDPIMGGGTATFDEFYNSLAGNVGNDVYQAGVNSDHQKTVNQQLVTYQQEVSGVSLDEEMVDLIQFQSAYEAAAKLVTTVDEMLEKLIYMV